MPQYHTPRARFRTDDAARYARSMHEQLGPWIAAAQRGEKDHPIASFSDIAKRRHPDDLACDCAQVLAAAPEWTGTALAQLLADRGWPADDELVRLCHAFSVGVKNKIMADLRARAATPHSSAA